MKNTKKVALISTALTIVSLLPLTGLHTLAADEQRLNEVYQAQAIGQSTQMGKTFNVTIHIDEYSTPEERQVLVDAFHTSGSKGLYNALDKMPAKGRIAITGTLGYDIRFARKLPTEEGFKLRVLTSRPINFTEAWNSGRSMDYNLSILELDINKETGKGTGTLMPASKFKIDKKSGEVVVEAFKNPWTLTNVMDRTKE
jgi:hypothetical protein